VGFDDTATGVFFDISLHISSIFALNLPSSVTVRP
jgi:hypothetical protein